VLRRWALAEIGRIVPLDAHPNVMRYISGGLATPREEASR
jgi:hypothetical protein